MERRKRRIQQCSRESILPRHCAAHAAGTFKPAPLFKKSPTVLRYFVVALRVVGSISRIILYPPLGGGGNTASFFTYDS